MPATWLRSAESAVAPRWALKRAQARRVLHILNKDYDAATVNRRTQGHRRSLGDANSAIGPATSFLRASARDLVRNNPYAESGLTTIVDHTVGHGIVATEDNEVWHRWAESTDVDADCRCDLAGLQKMVMRTVVESGEALVRRRFRRPSDGFELPMQLQVLEPDYLDTSRDMFTSEGGRVVQGVEFDAIGRRIAYWLFNSHPGATRSSVRFSGSRRVPASDVLHIFKPGRPGQVRGVTWFAPVLMRFRDLDEFEDATLVKQKIAACLAVFVTDIDGSATPLGAEDADDDEIDLLEPGMIMNVPPGKDIHHVSPPSVGEYSDYVATAQRGIAAGLGIGYEDLTGDYTNLPFSAARMSRIRHFGQVKDWRARIVVVQFLNPLWRWAMEVAAMIGDADPTQTTKWTAPSMPMIEPDKEGLAIMRNVRSGVQTLSESIRERGFTVEKFLDELQADFAALDARGLILDSDPRYMTQAGQRHADTDPGIVPPGNRAEALAELFMRTPVSRRQDLVDLLSTTIAAMVEARQGGGNGGPA